MTDHNTNTQNNTQGYVFNHTMLRVKDPQVSLDFYQNVLGLSLIHI